MNFIDKMEGMKRINLAGSGCRSSYIDSSYGSRGAKNHGTSRCSLEVLSMADPKPRNIRYPVKHFSFAPFLRENLIIPTSNRRGSQYRENPVPERAA